MMVENYPYTPEIQHGTQKLVVCRCFSFSKGVFSGSMLVRCKWKEAVFFQGVPGPFFNFRDGGKYFEIDGKEILVGYS